MAPCTTKSFSSQPTSTWLRTSFWGAWCLFGLFLCVTAPGCFATIGQSASSQYKSQRGWIVTAAQAKQFHTTGAIFLDVRSQKSWKKSHLTGSLHTTWQHFSITAPPNQGQLLDDDKALTQKLQALGVSKDKAVIVVGDPVGGWGEDGRIVWMLRSLGHTKASMVDGGVLALKQAGLPFDSQTPSAKKGDFVVKRVATWAATQTQIQQQLKIKKDKSLLIDTREQREYLGQTPYGESRGGHVPGAVHLHYKALLTTTGYLRSRSALLAQLKTQGITPDRPIIAYCTGGIRSGWFIAVLHDLGFKQVRNYAGSMWQWSAGQAADNPLVKGKAAQ